MLRGLYRRHLSKSYSSKQLARWFLQARKRYPLTCTKATTETLESAKTQGDDDDDEDVDIQIEGLTDDYCDDFVCTSSPAVEQTLRSLAKDLVRRKWTPVLFARDVKYRVRISFPNTVIHETNHRCCSAWWRALFASLEAASYREVHDPVPVLAGLLQTIQQCRATQEAFAHR